MLIIKKNRYLYLCVKDKFFIIEHQWNYPLNQKNELTLSIDTKINSSLWTTKPDHWVKRIHIRGFFLVRVFFCIWTEYGYLQCKSQFRSECREIWNIPTPNANNFHVVDVRTLLRSLIPSYCKFTVISWLNDCKDTKVLAATHIHIHTYIYIYIYFYFM